MNFRDAEARSRALAAVIWDDHTIDVADTEDGSIVRIKASMAWLPEEPVVVFVTRSSIGRAWRAAWPQIVRHGRSASLWLAVEASRHKADGLEAEELAAMERRKKINTIIDGIGRAP